MPRKQKKYHYIYKTTCQITGKFYVGMHSTDDLEDGYLGSGKILKYSLNKHGEENHIKEILEFLPTREALKLREKDIVNEELLAHPLNINLKYGGEGGWDHVLSNPNYKSPFCNPDIQRRGAILGAKAKKKLLAENADYRLAISKKISLALKGTTNFLGKTHSEETINKMKASHKGGLIGEKNGSFGTCWVSKDRASFKIKKENLDQYLLDGYSKGRTMGV